MSCKKDEDDTLSKQQTSITSYLRNNRRMVEEKELPQVLEENPPFYTQLSLDLYRTIPNYYDKERKERKDVTVGSEIEVNLNAYIFTSGEPQLAALYWCNNPAMIYLIKNGTPNPFVTLDWPREPISVTVGRKEVIRGVDEALVGCKELDSVQVYMTFQKAYGSNIIGVVPKKSAVAWYIKILRVLE